MKDISIILTLLFFNQNAYSQDNDEYKFFWSDSVQLNWSDFQSNNHPVLYVNNGEAVDAYSMLGMDFLNIDTIIECSCYKLRSYFDKSESWKSDSSDFLLQHEQIHFNIFELQTRKLRKHLLILLDSSVKINLDNEVDFYINELRLVQKKYDEDTHFGANMIEQNK